MYDLYHAIRNTANQQKKKKAIEFSTMFQSAFPLHAALIVLTTVFFMAWYKIIIQHILVVYISLISGVGGPYSKWYWSSYFPHRFMAQAPSARAMNQRGKTRIRNLLHGSWNEISKIFIISVLCVWQVSEWFNYIHAKRLQIILTHLQGNESIWNCC